ncbi:MAG TPA: glycosyltransferase family A protein [Caulobacteraceae bacterium]|nr:glycosyltransferase family A protein [Caulobacteraceae bacterium]
MTAVHDNAVVRDNAVWAAAAPKLSVLIPFYRDDPTRLLAALDGHDAPVEIVALDDGSGDPALAAAVAAAVDALRKPARFVRLAANAGRAAGRNRLAAEARARHLLFLDSDMLPDAPDFLLRWLYLIDLEDPAAAFGGFSLDQAPRTRANAVHRALALRSDCVPALSRRQAPEKYVFTSNLLIRRDVFEAEPFDADFVGWGWEDVEWGMRVSRRHRIHHIDNPATHLGLAPASAIAGKFEQSAANFARVVAAHGDIVRAYPSYRAAKALKRLPLRKVWRPWLKAAALLDLAPPGPRAFALRLYRAALYAEAV